MRAPHLHIKSIRNKMLLCTIILWQKTGRAINRLW